MDYALFIIDFLDGKGRGIHSKTIAAWDHLDACDHGWEVMPEGAEDFQVTELPFPPASPVEPEGTGPLLTRWLPKSVGALKENNEALQRMLAEQRKMLMCVAPAAPAAP